MELLLAFLATGITEIVKLLSSKFGRELSKTIVLSIVAHGLSASPLVAALTRTVKRTEGKRTKG